LAKAKELGDLLDQIDASALLFKDASAGGASSCGGKCYQGCRATTTPPDLNMPNVQPSSDHKGDKERGVNDAYKGTIPAEPSSAYKPK
jgi:hypothetical protein